MALLLRSIPKLRIHPSKTIFCAAQNISRKPTFMPYIAPTCQRLCSTKIPPPEEQNNQKPTLQQKLKKAVAEYGSTVIVFHVTISLASLGLAYLVVSSGLDVPNVLVSMGVSGETTLKLATGAGTFTVAYAVHKVFAPVRIMITLTATPFIVRYLRNVGILKKPIK